MILKDLEIILLKFISNLCMNVACMCLHARLPRAWIGMLMLFGKMFCNRSWDICSLFVIMHAANKVNAHIHGVHKINNHR